jgi:hypothetical protein
MTKFNHYNLHQSKSVTCFTLVLTWFRALLAFVEPPGCSDALTAFLLLAETREGLATLAFRREREREIEKGRGKEQQRERLSERVQYFQPGENSLIFLYLAG